MRRLGRADRRLWFGAGVAAALALACLLWGGLPYLLDLVQALDFMLFGM